MSKCVEWTGFRDRDGYGKRGWKYAHREAYEAAIGPIPEGLTIDHLCRNRACVNPEHMEPVTRAENVMRGEGIAAQYARRTHCKHGHEFTPENTRPHPKGKGRLCRACARLNQEAFRQRNPTYFRDWARRRKASA